MDRRYSVRIKAYGLDLENINSVYQFQKKRFPKNSGYCYHFFLDSDTNKVRVAVDHEDDVYIGEFDTLFYDLGGLAKHDLIRTIHSIMNERGIK